MTFQTVSKIGGWMSLFLLAAAAAFLADFCSDPEEWQVEDEEE